MRGFLHLLAIVPATAASAVIPHLERNAIAPRSSILELELHKHEPKALFRVPCQGCLGPDAELTDDEAFLFDFQANPSEEPCGVSNVTVNGITLAQTWNGTTASGEGSFLSIPSGSSLPQHELGLLWESACLFANSSGRRHTPENDGTAQVFTVTIQTIDGKKVETDSGFTISFKPISPLELLRLSVVPDKTASQKEFSEDWRNPPANLRLTALDADVLVDEEFDVSQTKNPSLREQILELNRLEEQHRELKRLIHEKRTQIREQMKEEVSVFKTDLHHCDSISCVFKTILDGAKGAIKVVYFKLKPEHHHAFNEGPGEYEHVVHHGKQFSVYEHGPPPPPPHGLPPPPPPHGLPPPPPPPPPPHHGPGGRRPPPPPPPHPLLITLEVFLSVTGLAALFTLVRRCFCSPRQRQDRASSREERRNVRAFRRAARTLRWRKWLYGLDSERMEDYEEKRSLIREQEDILESAMQEEIRMLREAHNVVHSIVQAEEGRAFRPTPTTAGGMPYILPHPNMSMQPCMHAHVANRVPLPAPIERPLSCTNSLPEYHSDADSMSEPPAYEEDADSSDIVVDGFREYTPSSSTIGGDHAIGGNGQRWTPGSSVIETSPRPSMETLESRIYEEVYERDSRARSSSCSSSQFGGSEKSG